MGGLARCAVYAAPSIGGCPFAGPDRVRAHQCQLAGYGWFILSLCKNFRIELAGIRRGLFYCQFRQMGGSLRGQLREAAPHDGQERARTTSLSGRIGTGAHDAIHGVSQPFKQCSNILELERVQFHATLDDEGSTGDVVSED